MNVDNLWIVVPVGDRQQYLPNLVSKLNKFSGRIVFINNTPEYECFDGVTHIEDLLDVNIYRWWNKGIRFAKDNGARYVFVLNDDIDITHEVAVEVLSFLQKRKLAIANIADTGNGGGAAWMMDLSYNLFANESFRWWYGDRELFDRAEAMGKFSHIKVKNSFEHFEPNNLFYASQYLQDLSREDAELYNRLSDLKSIYSKYSNVYGSGGGDKGTAHDYLGTYAKYINKRRRVSLLEIGVFRGESIRMWREYLHKSSVYGIDISLDNLTGGPIDNVFVCDATNGDDIQAIFSQNTFDYIIDDGSHAVEDQIAAFKLLFPKLKQNGVYFIEDILGDGPLLALTGFIRSMGLRFKIADTRRPETTYNDLILIIFKD